MAKKIVEISSLEMYVRVQRMDAKAGVSVVAHSQKAEEGGSLP